MDELIRKIRYELKQRNGCDLLGKSVAVMSLVLVTIGVCFQNQMFVLGGILGVGYTLFRILSKEKDLRKKENQDFLFWLDKIEFKMECKKLNIEMRKNYKYFKCRRCKRKLRVPRGKGRIQVTCPICGSKYIKKT